MVNLFDPGPAIIGEFASLYQGVEDVFRSGAYSVNVTAKVWLYPFKANDNGIIKQGNLLNHNLFGNHSIGFLFEGTRSETVIRGGFDDVVKAGKTARDHKFVLHNGKINIKITGGQYV